MGVTSEAMAAAKRLAGIRMAEAALKVARENYRQNGPGMIAPIRDIKLGLLFAGVADDDSQSLRLIHTDATEFKMLFEDAVSKLSKPRIQIQMAPAPK